MKRLAKTMILVWFFYSASAFVHIALSLALYAIVGIVFNPLGMDGDRIMAALGLWFVITFVAAFLKEEVKP